jgi:hypothetical protein
MMSLETVVSYFGIFPKLPSGNIITGRRNDILQIQFNETSQVTAHYSPRQLHAVT